MVNDINTTTLVNTAVLFTLSTPPGVATTALLRGGFTAGGSANNFCLVSSPSESDQAVTSSTCNFSNPVAALAGSGQVSVLTNTSSQVRARSSSAGNCTLLLSTYGWIDSRGQS
jgi:hypothetical protein